MLNPRTVRIGLAGKGEGLERRAAFLAEAGVAPILVGETVPAGLPKGLDVLFVAGLEREASVRLAAEARAAGALVNVEDVPELCDFHVPAVLRRGELMLTASTGGRAPGLARQLREWLETHFGPEWDAHLEEIGALRADWRAAGLAPSDVSRRTRALVQAKGWLA